MNPTDEASWQHSRAELQRLGEYTPQQQLDWLRQAFCTSRWQADWLRVKLDEVRAAVLAWPEVQARTLTVNEARLLGVCRVCKCNPPRVPTLLNFGEEFACEACVPPVKEGQ